MKRIEILKTKEKIALEKLEKIENKIKNIKNQIAKVVKIDAIKELKISEVLMFGSDNKILLEITPKSAWTNVLSIEFSNDNKIILKTSSGGWDIEENAFDETREILNHINDSKNKIFELTNKIYKLIEEKENIKYNILIDLKEEIKKLEREEIIENNGFKKLTIKDLDNNKDKTLSLYRINFQNKIDSFDIWYDKHSRRWTDGYTHFTRKELANNFYIKS